MSNKIGKEDLRIKKTHAALIAAMLKLLRHRNFKQITVNDICEEALVSRATFYLHFNDKYDLLKYWSKDIEKDIIRDVYNFEEIKSTVNEFIHKNQKILKNIFQDANNETLDLLHKVISSIIDPSLRRKTINSKSPNYIVLFNFCIGGLSELFLWQIKNNFPMNLNMIDDYLYKMLTVIMMWDAEQEEIE